MNKKFNNLDKLFGIFCMLALLIPLTTLVLLLAQTIFSGLSRISWQFLTGFPSRFAEQAGILPSLLGSFYLILLTCLIAFPLGLASAIYLEEYAKESLLKKIIDLNITNLAGVPSVIFGLLGLDIFARSLNLGPSLLTGALTLSLLTLPIIITSARESLKSVPHTFREAALSLGASPLWVVTKVVLPLALPQILTGTILAIARALGESAPLIVLGAATYLSFAPNSILSDFSALPLQIFHWIERPALGFKENAAAAIIILLVILAFFNYVIAYLRNRQEKKRGDL